MQAISRLLFSNTEFASKAFPGLFCFDSFFNGYFPYNCSFCRVVTGNNVEAAASFFLAFFPCVTTYIVLVSGTTYLLLLLFQMFLLIFFYFTFCLRFDLRFVIQLSASKVTLLVFHVFFCDLLVKSFGFCFEFCHFWSAPYLEDILPLLVCALP